MVLGWMRGNKLKGKRPDIKMTVHVRFVVENKAIADFP